MARYIGLLDNSGKTWGVRIPDFPGCHGGGESMEKAVEDATSALREFAADMEASGEEIPEPTDLGVIIARTKQAGEDVPVLVYIPLLLDEGRSVKANVSLDARLLKTIDEEAKRRGLTRSAFLASAAIEKIASER